MDLLGLRVPPIGFSILIQHFFSEVFNTSTTELSQGEEYMYVLIWQFFGNLLQQVEKYYKEMSWITCCKRCPYNLNFYKMQDRIGLLHQNGDIILQALFYFIAEYSELFKYSIGVDHVYV